MNAISPLLKRDWLEFRKHALSIISFWVLMPILIHVSMSIPLSMFISLNIRYLNWSSAGVWIATSSMVSFLITSRHLLKFHVESQQIDAILQSPITNLQLISLIIIKGSIYGICQFLFAIFITSTLNQAYFSISQIAMIFSQMIIIILTFSALGTLFGLIIPNGMTLIHIYSILFLLLSVGMGTFIPLDNYPGAYVSIIEKIPITFVFKNVQAAIINDPIQWLNYFLTIGMLFIIIVISLIITHKVFRKV